MKDLTNLQKLLDDEHQWPSEYTFKFIIPESQELRFRALFDLSTLSFKSSKTGKFVSITKTKIIKSSDEVIKVYEKASTVEGIISL